MQYGNLASTYHNQDYGMPPRGKGWRQAWERAGDGAAFPLALYQKSRHRFAVVYGKEVTEVSGYGNAASAIGLALLHSLSCEGAVDNG